MRLAIRETEKDVEVEFVEAGSGKGLIRVGINIMREVAAIHGLDIRSDLIQFAIDEIKICIPDLTEEEIAFINSKFPKIVNELPLIEVDEILKQVIAKS